MSTAESTEQDALAAMFPTKEEEKAAGKKPASERFKPRTPPRPRPKSTEVHAGTPISPTTPREDGTPPRLGIAEEPASATTPIRPAPPVAAGATPVPVAPAVASPGPATTGTTGDLSSPDVRERIGAMRLRWTDPETGEVVSAPTHERNLSIRLPILNYVHDLIDQVADEIGDEISMTYMTELAYAFLPPDPEEIVAAYRALRRQGPRKRPGPPRKRIPAAE